MAEHQRRSARTFWQRDGVFLVLLFLIFFLRYLPPFLRGDLFGPFRDNVWIYGPIFSKAAEIARHGSYPYWLDTVLTGYPLFDSPHLSTTYPLYFFGWLNYGIELDALLTLTRLTFLHLLLLALNSYIMIRLAGAGGFGALCGAIVALVNGSTTGIATWITIIASYSWLPLLIGSAIWLVKKPSFPGILLLTASASLLITASPAQSVIHSLLFCILFFGAALVWCGKNLGAAHIFKLTGSLLIALALVLALTAVATIPMTADTSSMIRHVGERTAVIGHERIPWKAFTTHQLEPHQLWRLFADSRPLGIIGGPYIGTLGLFGIALCLLCIGRHQRFDRFLLVFSLIFAVYGLLAGLGTHTGFTQIHYHLPLLNRIREAGRHLIWFTTFASLLAGLGFDALERQRPFQRSWLIALGLGAVIVFATVEVVFAWRIGTWNWLPFIVIPVGLLLFYVANIRLTKRLATGFLLCCIAAAVAHGGSTPQYLSSYYEPSNLTALRIIRRLTELPDVYNSRVAFRDATFWPGHWAMDASFYGLRSFYMDMTPVPYAQFLDMNRENLANYRELMGARYLVCGEKDKPRSPTDALLFQDDTYRVYRLQHAMAAAVIIHSLAGRYTSATEFYQKVEHGFDFNQVAYVESRNYNCVAAVLHPATSRATVSPDFLQLVKRDFNQRVYAAEVSIPSLLILNEYFSKAWHGRVNGREAPLLRVNLNQIGVLLRPGRNIVEFEYKPLLFWRLLLVQRATFVILLAGSAGHALRRSVARQFSGTSGAGEVLPADSTAVV